MLLRITRTRIRKFALFPKQNQKTANARQFFSREATGRTLNILITAEEPMKYSDLLYGLECFTGKYTTRKIHTKPHPGLEWRIFHILTSEDIDAFADIKFVS